MDRIGDHNFILFKLTGMSFFLKRENTVMVYMSRLTLSCIKMKNGQTIKKLYTQLQIKEHELSSGTILKGFTDFKFCWFH